MVIKRHCKGKLPHFKRVPELIFVPLFCSTTNQSINKKERKRESAYERGNYF